MAARAADAELEFGCIACALWQGLAAAATELVRADLQAVAYRYALIKHKAFALPQAVFGRHDFQVFQDAAL